MILAALLALVQPPGMTDDAWEVLRERIESAPPRVAAIIYRRMVCNDIRANTLPNPSIAPRLAREGRCDRIAQDVQSLRRTYRSRADVLRLLRDTENLLGF